jgi:hypothetical protein
MKDCGRNTLRIYNQLLYKNWIDARDDVSALILRVRRGFAMACDGACKELVYVAWNGKIM